MTWRFRNPRILKMMPSKRILKRKGFYSKNKFENRQCGIVSKVFFTYYFMKPLSANKNRQKKSVTFKTIMRF